MPAETCRRLDALLKPAKQKFNRLNYEICVLQALQGAIRCREIWVEGAKRYGNPDKDLPQDFEARRIEYYQQIGKPLDPEIFISKLERELTEELATLNQSIPNNRHVKIVKKRSGQIKLLPQSAQAEPSNLVALKTDIARRWPMASLLDVLKETDIRVGFTKAFQSPTP